MPLPRLTSELLSGLLTEPRCVFAKTKEKPELGVSLVLILTAWLNFLISILLVLDIKLSLAKFIVLYLGTSVFAVVSASLKTMGLHFLSEISGGKGEIRALFSALSWSMFPLQLSLGLSLMLVHTSRSLAVLGIIFLLGWSSSLGFRAVEEVYSLSARRTFVILLSPALIFLATLLVFVFLVLSLVFIP